jgi:hypothetical protein
MVLLGDLRRNIELQGYPSRATSQRSDLSLVVAAAAQQAQALHALADHPDVADAGGELADHPLTRLMVAYAEAFAAVRYAAACQQASPQGQAPLRAQLAELAERAGRAIAQAIELVFGERRLGSLTNVCAYIGVVEGQADGLLQRGIDSLLGEGGWDHRRAVELRSLLALEALTDRCEDIADALLLTHYMR